MEKTPRQIAKMNNQSTYMGNPCIHGHGTKRYTRNCECVACRSIAARAYSRLKHGRKVGRPRKYPELIGPPKPKRIVFTPITLQDKWIARSKGNGKRKDRKELSVAYYKTLLVTHCPLLGIELTYDSYEGHVTPYNYATLDKIIPSLGYVPGNVQIVSYRANTLKNEASLEEMEMMVGNLKKILAPPMVTHV